jgi:hypothetical protein
MKSHAVYIYMCTLKSQSFESFALIKLWNKNKWNIPMRIKCLSLEKRLHFCVLCRNKQEIFRTFINKKFTNKQSCIPFYHWYISKVIACYLSIRWQISIFHNLIFRRCNMTFSNSIKKTMSLKSNQKKNTEMWLQIDLKYC